MFRPPFYRKHSPFLLPLPLPPSLPAPMEALLSSPPPPRLSPSPSFASSCRHFASPLLRSAPYSSSSHSRLRAIPPPSHKRSPAGCVVRAESQAANDGTATAAMFGQFKRLLLPIIDRNPYLSEATRQAAATTTALAKRYGADITVIVIDEDTKESIKDHDLRINNIRWHLAEGGFEQFGLMERLGEGKRPAVVIGEVADDLALDLVILSMEAIHSKHIDGNLLAEFVPCPVLLLPL